MLSVMPRVSIAVAKGEVEADMSKRLGGAASGVTATSETWGGGARREFIAFSRDLPSPWRVTRPPPPRRHSAGMHRRPRGCGAQRRRELALVFAVIAIKPYELSHGAHATGATK